MMELRYLAARPANAPLASRLPRLTARIWRGAALPLKTQLLECLLRPLGPLGIAAVASGAFAVHLLRWPAGGVQVAIEQVARHSADEVLELAGFAAQVDTELWSQLATLLTDASAGGVALSIAALLVAVHRRGAWPAQ
jgi:hypothetical protein